MGANPMHRSKGRLVRSELGSGYVVSTVRLSPERYETAVFSPGWPDRGDAVLTRHAATPGEALSHHEEAVRQWAEPPAPAGWIFALG